MPPRKHAERHLVVAECQPCRLPGAATGVSEEMREEMFEAMLEEVRRDSMRRRRFIQTARTVLSPNREPASDAAKMVKTVSLVPRNAPISAISLTSPNPIPSTPRALRVNGRAPV